MTSEPPHVKALRRVELARRQFDKAAREVRRSMSMNHHQDVAAGTRLWFENALREYQQAVMAVPARLLPEPRDKILRRLSLIERKQKWHRRRRQKDAAR